MSEQAEVELCLQCGWAVVPDTDAFQNDSCILTPDALFVELGATEFGEVIFEMDTRFCWCNIVCLGKWMANAVARQAIERRVAA